MLPNTTVVEASTETNPDLFWAFENSGFILNATYRVYDQAPNGMNLNADFVYPSNVADAFYQKLKEIDPMPAPLSIATRLGWNAEYNDTTMTVKAVCAGPESEGREAIEFLLQLGPILQQNITEVPWHQVIQR
ncbi:FAD-linked oxidoreductase azaL [Lasiodiplodia theobromae]|uniref:FAD-linked oxidoreductase azaL n=1 Tax=Lasiodiplodia theobromae TaxID=45133 RepID=A0A5N5D5G3_9PEZI|nr:FAD-linked oxidoreductase azaL [Lasiodiplodia theobromae]